MGDALEDLFRLRVVGPVDFLIDGCTVVMVTTNPTLLARYTDACHWTDI